MPSEITMPQLSDTMTEGTLLKWNKKEGEKVKAGEEIADVETDKATMPMEAFESGTLALIIAREGQKVPVGGILGVIATGSEKVEEIKKQYAGKTTGAAAPAKPATAKPTTPAPASAKPSSAQAAPAKTPSAKPAAAPKVHYQFDLIVIGGGPAGYAAAIRAGQLKKRVLCIENENLGGTCLNWGCIPTKALLEDGQFVRRLRTQGVEHGVTYENLKVDYAKMVARSRTISGKLQKGIAHLFGKYEVKHEKGMGQLLGPHKVKLTGEGGTKEFSADHILLATGAKSTPLPGAPFDHEVIISSREAMNLPKQPKKLAIIGAGAIGCEFADFYNAIGTEVTLIEMLPQLLPIEDEDVSQLLKRTFEKHGIKVHLKTKTEKVEKTKDGVKLTLSAVEGGRQSTVEADAVLVAIGVTGNTKDLAGPECKLELVKNRVKVTPDLKTNLENVYAAGDCVSLHFPAESSMAGYRHPDLAHVAHHEAVNCVDRIFSGAHHEIDYGQIPGCTYTHPQVASMGMTEKKAREAKHEVRIGKFPFAASGRAMASGETDGFVKLIFDAKYGEILGVHMIGEQVTELLSELVLARKLEATDAELIETMHPHPTLSEAVMEAAGAAVGRAIHL